MPEMGLAVTEIARLILYGENGTLRCFKPDASKETAPQTCGLAMEVPFISWNENMLSFRLFIVKIVLEKSFF
jgi:hypothetical protein